MRLSFHIKLHWLLAIASAIVGCQSIGRNTQPKTTAAVATITTDTTKSTKKEPPVWAAKKYGYNPSRTLKNDLVHTKLEVELDWKKRYLLGVATLTLRPHFFPQNTLELDAKGFDIKSVKLLVSDKKSKLLKYNYNNTQMTIYLDTLYTCTDEYRVEIEYVAKPDELVTKGSAAITSDKGLYFINPDGTDPDKPRQVWTQGETQSASCWFPTIDSPNQRCTDEIHITVDTNFVTLSNGLLVYSTQNPDGTRTDVWEQKKPHAPYLFTMVVGDFAIIKDRWRNKEVNYYVEPKYAPYGKAIFGHTPEMIEFFSQKLGVDFVWDKYSQVVVRDFVSGAMENTSASTFMEAVQSDDRALLDQDWDGIIAHELFHQWFGDLVTCESWSNLPLNESFANYSEYLWAEHKFGIEQADFDGQQEKQQYFRESQRKREPLIRYYYNDREQMFDSHSYAKGGRVLHMLRKYVGDEAFFESIKRYLLKNQFSSVEIHNLRLAFEEVTGEDLNWFFNQWFMSAGHPELEVNYSYSDKKVWLKVRQTQDSLYSPKTYRLPLKVDIWVKNQKLRYPITIDEREQEFTFAVDSVPQLLVFDGEQQLLASIDQTKTQDELRFQYYHGDKMKLRLDALRALDEDNSPETQAMLSAALSDRFWAIRVEALQVMAELDSQLVANNAQKMKDLAKNDPKAAVRAEAFRTLQRLQDSGLQSTFAAGLSDRSYDASAAALEGYIKTKPSDIEAKIADFEAQKHPYIAPVAAEYYAQKTDSTYYNWFTDKIKTGSKDEMYGVLQSFAVYLLKMSKAKQAEGVALIVSTAQNSKASMLRFAAYQALGILSEVAGVEQHKVAIREAETDPELKKIYEYFR
ncbi:aminopeptidase N [Flexibacter flexilis DSM 6793]|uniref:Aminopeptidase N n=1 Tax=Flexibacter flexilis DSM 6793 TaxID=927664 RepID=A0A1I1LNI7_9BACT|nr:M1 family metallopeptidase [Flexibacter flexilis]SFC74621.1 aminopeptidase N [Flexibacter flexilis DSM 6793]